MSRQNPISSDTLLCNFGRLFLLCKFFGIYPHSLRQFQKHHILVGSRIGQIFVIVSMSVTFSLYNVLIYSFPEDDMSIKSKQSTLTSVIGLFLNYIGPAMMIADQVSAILNQSKIGKLFERIELVDNHLRREDIFIENEVIKKRIDIMLIATFVFELIIMISTYVSLNNYSNWISILWIVISIPTLFSTLDKIWFAAILHSVKMRFSGINSYLEYIVQDHLIKKGGTQEMEYVDCFNREHLHEEDINNSEFNRLSERGNKIHPLNKDFQNSIRSITYPKHFNYRKEFLTEKQNILTDIPKINEKFNILCQLHDEICEIGKFLNELWSFPILILMAYGFLIFTAQLYFLYCGTQDQPIPNLFRSARSAPITTVFLLYISGKCVFLIYLSWKTSLESKRTGILLHKCGVAVDNNELYEIINHLSLKLLNHSVDFSACGFFSLDMETLYGVTGGITSYLIILIQFNLAAQQAKEAIQVSMTTSGDTIENPIFDEPNGTLL